jgi:hypothetical protein
MGSVALFGSRLFVAFDASTVSAAAVGAGVRGRRLRSFHRVSLSPGAIVPSPAAPNLVEGEQVRVAVRRAVERAAPAASRTVLVLPDGVARLFLLDVPRGARARDFVRFRVAPSLPWLGAETIVDVLPAGRERVVGAAVGRATVAEYEQAARGAGLEVDRVHLAPLLSLAGLLRAGDRGAVHVVLGDVALCLFCFRNGELAVVRSRRRDPSQGEAARLLGAASRAAALSGDGEAPPRVALHGAGALLLRHEVALAGAAAEALPVPAGWPDAAEAAWLAGVLA